MDVDKPAEHEPREPARLRSFHDLMQRRVQRVLLVSSLYDSFVLSEEGRLHETLLGHFLDLNLSHFPDVSRVPSGAEALELLRQHNGFDLVVSSVHTGDGNAADLCRSLRAAGIDVPVVALAYSGRELSEFVAANDTSQLERIFIWQGDVRILLAIVKFVEDRLNVAYDTGVRGVPVIIVVEDNIRFYSSFLPTIYAEVYRHTHRLLSEDLNLSQKMLRMRARPKVLLADDYEEAWDYFARYEEHVLGVISDVEFPKGGVMERHAGLDLCARVHRARPDIRLVLQSSFPENRKLAEEMGASFLLKGSPVLLHQLRDILVERFGFGDFIFRLPDQSEIDRAHDLKSLAEKLATVPAESIGYHAERNHFSNWLKARTEFALAERLRPRRVEDFESLEHLRGHLLEMIHHSRQGRHRAVIADFQRDQFESTVSITRIGNGGLGGKARGLAFANRVLRESSLDESFPQVDLDVPPCVVLGTGVFDEFLEHPGLEDYALESHADGEIVERFQDAPLSGEIMEDLRAFLEQVRYPLAVRSSSLLEDSLAQPFAGVYQTHMLPNNDPDFDLRLGQLESAIKRVYASTFSEQAKGFLGMTAFRLEEEKMAVMIQELIGTRHGERFYPDFAGVARSHNFYPEPDHSAADGVVAVALGMGRMVVDGGPCLRFCPKHPRRITSFSSVADVLENSQVEFYGIGLERQGRDAAVTAMRRYPLEVAERDGPLAWLGSTYVPEDQRIVDGVSRPGVRVVTFAQVLKHDAFPLAALLSVLLEQSAKGTGAPVEIEFAGNLARAGQRARLAFLQLRPLALSLESEEVEIGEVAREALLCRSKRVLGNGRLDRIRDLVVVDIERFERLKSHEVALDVARFDAILRKEERPYVLVGVGRWGSTDPNLGIPVGWTQISGARVIVEAGFRDIRVAPSQGTHFFQNLTSSNVGYFTVDSSSADGFLDWEWLARIEPFARTKFVRHLRLERPVVVKMSARTGEGVILKPSQEG